MPGKTNTESRSGLLAGAAVTGLLSLAYMSLWWNRFLGLSDGMFLLLGQQVVSGRVPYRDFYFSIPPLQPLKMAGLIAVFGQEIIVSRAWGMLERTLLSVLIYLWLAHFFRVRHAFLGTLTAMVLFCGDRADPVFSYHHDSVFWAVCAGFCASFLLRTPSRHARALAFVSGICCGLCFLTKQTTGLGMSILLPVMLGLTLKAVPGSPGLRSVLTRFCIGWALPVGLLWGWLFKAGALGAYFEQVFLKGPSSKGSLVSVLTRPLWMPFMDKMFLGDCVIALAILGWLWATLQFSQPRSPTTRSGPLRLMLAFLAGAGAILLGVFLCAHVPASAYLIKVEGVATYLSFLGSLGLWLYHLGLWNRRRLRPVDSQLWLFSAVSFTVAYMLALSWAAYEPMVVPGLALVIAFFLDRLQGTSPAKWTGYALTAGALGLISAAVWLKLALPYFWNGSGSPPVATATRVSKLPELRGLILPESTVKSIERLTDLLSGCCPAGESVYAYPYLPLLYALSHRAPPTFALVHWLDVAPDYVAEQDARTLLETRPAVMVYLELSPSEFQRYESVFRGPKPSGQRRLVDAIKSLAKEYRLVDAQILPVSDTLIRVYMRPDIARSAVLPR